MNFAKRLVNCAFMGVLLLGVLYFTNISFVHGQLDESSSVSEPTIDNPIFTVAKHDHPQVELAGSATTLDTEKDKVPNFAASPTVLSKQDGSWFSPSTWVQGRVPGLNDVVKIAYGHNVTYDGKSNVELAALGIEGKLTFSTSEDTLMKQK